MKEFTFITFTYNHSEYIIEHLESIKFLISNYGNTILFDFIMIDDCSKDDTFVIAEKWLNKNKQLFRNIQIIKHKENQGIVNNIIECIGIIKTGFFKFLAGDDKYTKENMFEVYDILSEHSIVITPTQLFGVDDGKLEKNKNRCISLIDYANKKGKMKELIEYYNYIFAPGVFISKDLLTDDGFLTFIKQFRNIEDYPMWYYFIVKMNCLVVVLKREYIVYRVGSGISKDKNHPKRLKYFQELKMMNELLDVKSNKYPRFINPFFYRYLTIRIPSIFHNI